MTMFQKLAQFHVDKTHPYRTNGPYEVSPMLDRVQSINRAVYSPDGKYLVVLTADECCMWIFAVDSSNARALDLVACVPFLYPVTDMVFGPAGTDHVIVYTTIGSVTVRDMKTGRYVTNSQGHEAGMMFGGRQMRYLLGCTATGDIVWAVRDKTGDKCTPEPRELTRCLPHNTAPRSDTQCLLFSYMQGCVIQTGDLRCDAVRTCINTPIRIKDHGVVGGWPRAGDAEVDVADLGWTHVKRSLTGVVPTFIK
jgi:hypothetical protein